VMMSRRLFSRSDRELKNSSQWIKLTLYWSEAMKDMTNGQDWIFWRKYMYIPPDTTTILPLYFFFYNFIYAYALHNFPFPSFLSY
jgi:hypothetical protein